MQPANARRTASRIPIIGLGCVLLLCLCLVILFTGGGAGYWFILRPATQTAQARLVRTQRAETQAARPTRTATAVPTLTPTQTPTITPPQPLKLAVLAPLSGVVPSFGVSVQDGVMMAVDEWNARGGVLGRTIEALVYDSQCEAAPAIEAANLAIEQEEVHYLIGEVCSKASIPVSEIAEANGIVQISPSSTNEQVTVGLNGLTKRFVFRACVIDAYQGTVMAKFALQQGYRSAYLMVDPTNDYSSKLTEAFETAFVLGGGAILGRDTYAYSDTDFSTILGEVAESQAEVLYLPEFYPIANLVGAQVKQMELDVVMLGGDGWDSSELDRAALDGGYYTNHWIETNPAPEAQAWIASFQQHTGYPADIIAAFGYDAANLMLTAIARTGVDDPDLVRQTLEGLTFQGITGVLWFDAWHNPIKSMVIVHVTGGQVVYGSTVNP